MDTKEIYSTPATPDVSVPPIFAPPSQFQYNMTNDTTRTPTQLPMSMERTSPMVKVIVTMQEYLDNVGHLTPLDPMDDWLPITESRKGSALSAAFHTLCSGIGVQVLLLPVAFRSLGWIWGIVCMVVVFAWQLYTLWMLTRLHESQSGKRYSRYLQLCNIAFGEKLGKALVKFPIMYLSGGTCTSLIIIAGGSMKLFFELVVGPTQPSWALSGVEWYLVFVCLAVALSQLPNLHSIAGVSLVGAVSAVCYCTLVWSLSVGQGRPDGVSYEPGKGKTVVGRILGLLNGIGIIAFAFRGHNLALEIQATMPSNPKKPSYVPMWKGETIAYAVIALCLFPVAIGGYWTYGDMIPPSGILTALHKYHDEAHLRVILGLTTLLVIISCLSSFQIYAMPVFDTLELTYTSKHHQACPRWVRCSFRVFFGALTFFIAVTFPFLPDLAGLLGGISLPVTLAYPCFMWALIKKPSKGSGKWWVSWGLGAIGVGLSVLLTVGGIWNLVDYGLRVHFFRARPVA